MMPNIAAVKAVQNGSGLTDTEAKDVWKPLGKGYRHFPELYQQYCNRANPSQGNPDLQSSLSALRLANAKQIIIGAVGNAPRCLIEGISCGRNASALRRYLSGVGIPNPQIHAIDIIDVDQISRSLGIPLPDVDFSIGDAGNLPDWEDHSVQILVQDHLLNCCPHRSHASILKEAARVLDPRGVFILNFSVDPPEARTAISRETAEHLLGQHWREDAYSLEDVAPTQLEKTALLGRAVRDPEGRYVLVTRPWGNFEFYFSVRELKESLEQAGLRFVFQHRARAGGADGTGCLRYHTLVQHY